MEGGNSLLVCIDVNVFLWCFAYIGVMFSKHLYVSLCVFVICFEEITRFCTVKQSPSNQIYILNLSAVVGKDFSSPLQTLTLVIFKSV